MIITVIEDIASYLSLSFYHGRDDFQNLNADEESLPALYLDTPLRNSYAIAQSGYISDTFDVSLMFMYKSELDWTPEQHDTNCIQLAEEKIREFLVYCQDNDNIEEITNINGLEFINLFDTNVSGKILNLTIKLYNTYSVCKPVCEGVTLLINGTELNYLSGQTTTLAVTLDGTPSGTYNETTNTWEVESEPCPPSEIDITFDSIPLGTATTSPYNIDCSTGLDIAIVSGDIRFDGTYVANGTENTRTRYLHETNPNLRIRVGIGNVWQIVHNSLGVISQVSPTGQDYPWEADWDAQVEMSQGTISDYCGGAVCADATVTVNGNAFDTVASGGTLDVPVVNEDDGTVGVLTLGKIVIANSDISINGTLVQSVLATEAQGINVYNTDGTNVGSQDVGNWEVPDATQVIKDSAGTTLYTNAIPSGNTENQTITDSTVENSDASYTDTILAQDSLILPDITITKPDATTISFPSVKNVDVRDYKSGIAYQRPQLTGQTTSYRTGDAVWVATNIPDNADPLYPTHIATLVDFYTLANNNVFGNTLRFTDQTGNAALQRPYVSTVLLTTNTLIDHYTGREWAVNNAQQGNAKNWNTAIDECLSLTANGFDDWYLPSAQEWQSVVTLGGNGLNFNAVFGIASRIHWTSNTDFNDTTYGTLFNLTTSTTNLFGRVLKTSNYNYYPVRKRY